MHLERERMRMRSKRWASMCYEDAMQDVLLFCGRHAEARICKYRPAMKTHLPCTP